MQQSITSHRHNRQMLNVCRVFAKRLVSVVEWLAPLNVKWEVSLSKSSILPLLKHACGKVTGYYAGHMHFQRCHTRGESQGTYASTKCKKVAHSDFETKIRHYQKSKTGVSMAPKWTYVHQKFLKKAKTFKILTLINFLTN